MAEYKVVNATQLDNDLTRICNYIREKADGSIVGKIAFPNDMEEALNMMSVSIADRNYAEGKADGYNEGHNDGKAEVTDMLCALTRRKGTELNCDAIVFGEYACYGWSELIRARLPVARYFSKYSFRNCTGLTTMDIGDPTRTDIYPSSPSSVWFFANFTFNGATALETLILRPNVMAKLESTSVFSTCPVTSGTGYIYVPSALVDEYKSATNWSSYADKIRAIEDYPEITGGAI